MRHNCHCEKNSLCSAQGTSSGLPPIRTSSSLDLPWALSPFLISSVTRLTQEGIHLPLLPWPRWEPWQPGEVHSSRCAQAGLPRAPFPGWWLSSGGHLLRGCCHLPGHYQSRGESSRVELNGPKGSTAQSQVKGSSQEENLCFTEDPPPHRWGIHSQRGFTPGS